VPTTSKCRKSSTAQNTETVVWRLRPRVAEAEVAPAPLAAQVTVIAWLGGCTSVGIVITKDLYTYTIIILRQDKSLRDHGRAAVCRVIGVDRDKGDMRPLACAPGPAAASVESALRQRAAHKGGGTGETTVVLETGLERHDPRPAPTSGAGPTTDRAEKQITAGQRLRDGVRGPTAPKNPFLLNCEISLDVPGDGR
jgi:hypothetical protein